MSAEVADAGAVAPVQDSSPEVVQDQAPVTPEVTQEPQDAEIPQPYHKDPAWQRIKGQRDEFKSKYEAVNTEVAGIRKEMEDLKGLLAQQAPKPAEPNWIEQATAGMDEADRTAFQKLYPAFEQVLVGRLTAAEQAQKAEQEKLAAQQKAEQEQVNKQAEQMLGEVKTKLGTDDEFNKFSQYVTDLVSSVPAFSRSVEAGAMTLGDFYDLYQRETKSAPVKPIVSKVGTPSRSGQPEKSAMKINRNEDFVSAAKRAAAEMGLIK